MPVFAFLLPQPWGDGYGGLKIGESSMLGEAAGKPWWWDYDGAGPRFTPAAFTEGDFLPVRGPPCPPDCTGRDTDSPQPA